MLNRRHIRIKVMQLIYALHGDESIDLKKQERILSKHMEGMYHLYLTMMSLFIEVHKKAEDYLLKSQKKHLATAEEKSPNTKFITNQILCNLKDNTLLTQKFEDYNIDYWQIDNEYIDIIFKDIISSELYKDYMSTKTSTFQDDKRFVIAVFKTIIAPNQKLYDYLEDKNITWIDDIPVVNTAIVKLLNKTTTSPSVFVSKLFKNEDDKIFASQLLSKTVLNLGTFASTISEKTKNWDKDRIANIDFVLLQMAICEFQKFPSIPVKVSINEYLEIAKEYSTPKSSVFINGILDRLVKEYNDKGLLNKIGRGLM